jgi:N-formylglutamate amidohydrolase
VREALFVAALALVSASPLPASAEAMTPATLVLVQSGTMPIVLTAPHGGRQAVPGIPPRNIEGKPKGGSGYETGADVDTDILVQGLAREIRRLTGKDVYLVMAKFQRKFIDANRPPKISFDSPGAEPYYQYYHRAIRGLVDEIRKNYSTGLLIDVHGQGRFPDAIVRGTHNGRSVAKLLDRAGFAAITGPKGLFGRLEIHGFTVFPSNDVPPRGDSENAGFNGGYTVGLYGSERTDGIDAVQFEFGTRYRLKGEIDATIGRAAASIVEFYEAYLKIEPNKAK